ncbi:hypothetical protein ROHU_028596 [Labeo rohita]|uniref:Uncharacterized protein n=1 Tax=Labeo rohita TaxID=84645 RepID=A0A498LBK5_LABRO|nr:hypothetical protein ROHU_033301 [Labeo rohita]RXN14583.1 hypothetical protein ROHU_028596 [Labeo rohita]
MDWTLKQAPELRRRERVSLEPLNLGNRLEPYFSIACEDEAMMWRNVGHLGRNNSRQHHFQELKRFGLSPGRLQLNLPLLHKCLGSKELEGNGFIEFNKVNLPKPSPCVASRRTCAQNPEWRWFWQEFNILPAWDVFLEADSCQLGSGNRNKPMQFCLLGSLAGSVCQLLDSYNFSGRSEKLALRKHFEEQVSQTQSCF